jgi:hypothetical protein
MACKKTIFRPFSCALSLLTVLAFIGLALRSGDGGLSHKSFAVYKLKQERTVDSLCFEQEEEGNEVKFELPLHGQSKVELNAPDLFISVLSQLSLKHLTLNLNTNKQPHYILYRSLII